MNQKNNTIKSVNNLIIYWLNMEASKKRRKYMKKVLQDPVFKGIPVERRIAFDADKENVMDRLIITKKSPHMKHSTYGCLVSHLDTIHAFSKSDYDYALIFEDDMSLEFKPFWDKPLIEIMDKCPADWEVIQLGYGLNTNKIDDFPKKEYTPMEIGNYPQTVSYLISKKGAARLMKDIYVDGKYTLYNNICQEADNFIYNVLRTYTYQIPYFTNNTRLASTIHNEQSKFSKLSKELLREHFFTKKRENLGKKTQKKRGIKWRTTRCIHGKRKIGFIHSL